MVTVSNFSSVFEIAFAINAILYWFELAPASDGRLEQKLKRFYDLREKKVALTGNHEAFPIGFYINSTYTVYRYIIGGFSIIFSLCALSLLIYSGYYPEAEMSKFWMTIILIILLGFVPMLTFMIHRRASGWIEAATDAIEEQVSRAKNKT